MTGASGASFETVGATLNVIHVPRPMTGSRSVVPGMRRVMGVRSCAPAAPGNICAATIAAAEARKWRRDSCETVDRIAVRRLERITRSRRSLGLAPFATQQRAEDPAHD